MSEDEIGNPLGWGKAEENASDEATDEKIRGGQIRDPLEPADLEGEHQGEERERGS